MSCYIEWRSRTVKQLWIAKVPQATHWSSVNFVDSNCVANFFPVEVGNDAANRGAGR